GEAISSFSDGLRPDSWNSRSPSRRRRNARESPGRRSYELSRELVEGDLGEVLPRFERPRFRHRVLRYGAVAPPSRVPRRTCFRHLSGCSVRSLGGHAGDVRLPTRGGQGGPVPAAWWS